jgi:hypothetical protein
MGLVERDPCEEHSNNNQSEAGGLDKLRGE